MRIDLLTNNNLKKKKKHVIHKVTLLLFLEFIIIEMLSINKYIIMYNYINSIYKCM